jgi:hypothetical protein
MNMQLGRVCKTLFEVLIIDFFAGLTTSQEEVLNHFCSILKVNIRHELEKDISAPLVLLF